MRITWVSIIYFQRCCRKVSIQSVSEWALRHFEQTLGATILKKRSWSVMGFMDQLKEQFSLSELTGIVSVL